MKNNLILGKILLVVFSVIFALILGEAAARLLLPPPARISGAGWIYDFALGKLRHVADPEIGWVLSPESIKSRHRSIARDGSLIFDVTYSIANGQRLTASRKVTGPQIICTGASFTFGHGLRDEHTGPWLLQERMPDYHVVNVASMAYGTDQALLAAGRQVLRSKETTRVVVLGFSDFHMERNRSSQGWLVHVYPFGKPLYVKNNRSLEYKGQVKFFSLGSILGRSALASHVSNKLANILRDIPSFGDSEVREVTVMLIIQWARQLESKGITLVVVMLPWHRDHTPASRSDRTFVIERLRAAQIHVFVPDFPRLNNGEIDGDLFWISNQDRHPNRHYNMLIANQLSRFLETSVLDR